MLKEIILEDNENCLSIKKAIILYVWKRSTKLSRTRKFSLKFLKLSNIILINVTKNNRFF